MNVLAIGDSDSLGIEINVFCKAEDKFELGGFVLLEPSLDWLKVLVIGVLARNDSSRRCDIPEQMCVRGHKSDFDRRTRFRSSFDNPVGGADTGHRATKYNNIRHDCGIG